MTSSQSLSTHQPDHPSSPSSLNITPFRPQQPLVCCAKDEPQPVTPRPTVPPTGGPFTGDPERHPNRGLLPIPGQFKCGTSDFTIKIVGGVIADLGEFPWVVMLGYESEWSRHAKGTEEGTEGEAGGRPWRGWRSGRKQEVQGHCYASIVVG